MPEDSKYLSNFSPLNESIPIGMTPFTESLKNTYERVIPFYENEIKKNLSRWKKYSNLSAWELIKGIV